ncbi:myosin-9-like [Mya arenaria]|uniref:myosin-9-like n=1 Tax=Mya arenaria TaxID=6604 RepID=UPI0022E4ACEF|nr:myosin-9-like [Mya arenaria]XP_052801371.1 myosin-9-like [Mya arenaria]XP_052801372.1 myosin-9-like [Mya arenaria]
MMESEEFESLRPKTARNISSHGQCSYESTRRCVVPEKQSDAIEELMQHVDAIQKLGPTLRTLGKTESEYRSLIRTLKGGNENLEKEIKPLRMNGSPSDVEDEKRRAQEFEAKYRDLAKRAKSEIIILEGAKLKYKNEAKMSQDIISDKENEICVVRKELEQAKSLWKNLNSKLKETESELDKVLQDKEILQKALHSSRETLNESEKDIQREVSKSNERERSCKQQLERVRTELRDVKHELDNTKKDNELLQKTLKTSEHKFRHEVERLQEKLFILTEEKRECMNYHNQVRRMRRIEDSSTHSIKGNISESSARENTLLKQLECLQARLRNVQEELNDTKERCHNNHWQSHTDIKPDIPRLSDWNRPTKMAERYKVLYDNQWTDAFETLDKVYLDEKETTDRLISILLETSTFCMKQSQIQLAMIKSAVIASADRDSSLPVIVSKQLKECRKAVAETAGKNILQEYICQLRQSTSRTARDAVRVEEFVEECFNICWLISIHDPPVVLDEEFQSGGRFDSEIYKAYSKSGPTNDFLVWPAMFLYKGGPVL